MTVKAEVVTAKIDQMLKILIDLKLMQTANRFSLV